MGNTDNFFEKKHSWSNLKDNILDWYLKPYFAKILQTGKPVRVIDCFAGKGRFDDGHPGSPIIIANHIQGLLNENPRRDVKGFFIEKKYFKNLDKNISGYINCQTLNGTYEDHIVNLLKNSDGYTLYTDHLDYDHATQTATTDARIRLVGDDMHLEGTGLAFNLRQERLSLKADVKGIFDSGQKK
jgi:hypothetical protein